jgi:hypothetical protein
MLARAWSPRSYARQSVVGVALADHRESGGSYVLCPDCAPLVGAYGYWHMPPLFACCSLFTAARYILEGVLDRFLPILLIPTFANALLSSQHRCCFRCFFSVGPSRNAQWAIAAATLLGG